MKHKSVKIGQNSTCPCGSGKKYKNCCRNKKIEVSIKKEYKRRYDIHLKEPHEIEGIRKSGKLLLSILDQVENGVAIRMAVLYLLASNKTPLN